MGWRAPARTTGRPGSRAGLRERGERVSYPHLPDPFDPHPADWDRALDEELALLDAPVVLCHSLACLLWLRTRGAAQPERALASRVLLVAPPCRDDIEPVARFLDHGARSRDVTRAAGETLIVCSDDDPYCPPGAVATYAEPLGIPAHVIAGRRPHQHRRGLRRVARTWRRGRSGRPPSRFYTRAESRACGGIGRRARLRALWAVWPVGVRVSLGALEKPANAGFSRTELLSL